MRATRQGAWLSWWHAVLAIAVVLLASCVSIQVPPPSSIAKEGAHATAITRFGPVFVVRTVTVLPGTARASGRFSVLDQCYDRRIHVAIRLQERLAAHKSKIPPCAAVLRGLQYAMDVSAIHDLQLSLTVDLVGPDTLWVERSSSLATARRAGARYAFAVDEDGELVSANVVSTTAHETLHLLRGLRGAPPEVEGDEELAYTMGACAQLTALGWVRAADLPSVAIPRGVEGISDSVAASNAAGVSMKKKLEPFMRNGVVTSSSTDGSAMKQFCLQTFRRG